MIHFVALILLLYVFYISGVNLICLSWNLPVFSTPNAGGIGSTSGEETKILYATWHGQMNFLSFLKLLNFLLNDLKIEIFPYNILWNSLKHRMDLLSEEEINLCF